jgi:hypothetical protein
MPDNAPKITPEDELPADIKELTREQRLSKARNAAQSGILKKYRKEFDADMVKQAAALGVEWAPRAATAEEKALEQVEAILAKFPGLAREIVGLVLDDEHDKLQLEQAGDGDPDRTKDLSGEPVDDEEIVDGVSQRTGEISRPTKAWVAGALREGRVTLDEPYTFVYSVGGGDIRRVTVDDVNVKLVED